MDYKTEEYRAYQREQKKIYLKTINYQNEKTPSQRAIRYIKRCTRRKYPLTGQICKYCPNSAMEHHHTTIPITVDEFEFICKECHKKIPKKLKTMVF